MMIVHGWEDATTMFRDVETGRPPQKPWFVNQGAAPLSILAVE